MIRVLVIGSMLLIAQAAPAFAEKIYLACSYDSSQYVTTYITFDTDAKTVKEPAGTFKARITDDAVTWFSRNAPATYDRQTRQLSFWLSNQMPVPCVRATEPPF